MVQTTLGSLWTGSQAETAHHMPSLDDDRCHVQHDGVAVYLSLFLCIGLVISYLPQVFRIAIKKSSQGFSPWFLLLGATSAASSFLNVVALQWGAVRCCPRLSAGQCAESLLGMVQVGTQWAMFNIVLIMFLVYYPKDLRYERAIALPPRQEQRDLRARRNARLAAKRAAAKRQASKSAAKDNKALAVPAPKPPVNTSTDDASSTGSGHSDLDSVDSHVARNYADASQRDEQVIESSSEDGDAPRNEEEEEEEEEEDEDPEALHSFHSRRQSLRDASSSAFSRLAPTFWPMWKAPGEGGSGANNGAPPSRQGLLASAPRGLRRIDQDRRSRQSQRSVKTRKRRTEEWSLALALAWVVMIHFVFILAVTLLLVSSLPAKSFPPPEELPGLSRWTQAVANLHHATALGPSSRLLVSRWAAFLGTSALVLATGQYIPQIVHTARTQLVGSLSIPMMCIQVPGSALFVYSLALQPGTDWSSLAAFCLTGVFQFVLLVLCITWRIRQHRAGIDDFGNPLAATVLQ